MIKRIMILICFILFIYMVTPLVTGIDPFTALTDLSSKYVGDGPDELGAQNIVTAVIVTYRGLDTLGEVAVLFIAAAGVGYVLRKSKEHKEAQGERREASEILKSGAEFLLPLLLLFGVYIFIHGHLTPGGGFQGGVVIASGFLLIMLSDVSYKLNSVVLALVESLSGAIYVILGVLGIILAGGFLDNRFLPLGEYGTLLSAGAIPLIYTVLGLKVGSELIGILKHMKRSTK